MNSEEDKKAPAFTQYYYRPIQGWHFLKMVAQSCIRHHAKMGTLPKVAYINKIKTKRYVLFERKERGHSDFWLSYWFVMLGQDDPTAPLMLNVRIDGQLVPVEIRFRTQLKRGDVMVGSGDDHPMEQAQVTFLKDFYAWWQAFDDKGREERKGVLYAG